MQYRNAMRFCQPVLAVLLLAALIPTLALQNPAHSNSCLVSPAANQAGALYALGQSAAALPLAEDAIESSKID